MKTGVSLFVCVAAGSALAGEFVNLTFDQPDLSKLRTSPSTGFPSAPVGDLLRGWEVSIRAPTSGEWSSFRDEIAFTLIGGGLSPIALNSGMHFDRTDLSVWFYSIPATGSPPGPDPPHVRLSTTGTVPENALTFDWHEGSSLELTISDGVRTVTNDRGQTSMNISEFSGKEVTISFFQVSGGFGSLDVIGFSVVPEPETWALLGFGLVGLFAWYQCKRS